MRIGNALTPFGQNPAAGDWLKGPRHSFHPVADFSLYQRPESCTLHVLMQQSATVLAARLGTYVFIAHLKCLGLHHITFFFLLYHTPSAVQHFWTKLVSPKPRGGTGNGASPKQVSTYRDSHLFIPGSLVVLVA